MTSAGHDSTVIASRWRVRRQASRRWDAGTARDAGVLMTGDSGAHAVTPEIITGIAPENILQGDEEVILLIKPSLFYIFYTSFVFVLVALMMGVAAAQVTRYGNLGIGPPTVAFATVLAVVGRLIWALLVWTSHIYMLTNQRIVTIKGVINVHMFQTQLRKVQKTDVYRPIAQRIFLTGTLGFSTAAAAGSADSTWVMIARPMETHRRIVEEIQRTRG